MEKNIEAIKDRLLIIIALLGAILGAIIGAIISN